MRIISSATSSATCSMCVQGEYRIRNYLIDMYVVPTTVSSQQLTSLGIFTIGFHV